MSRHAPYFREMGLVRWRYSSPAPEGDESVSDGPAPTAGPQSQGTHKDLARLGDEVVRAVVAREDDRVRQHGGLVDPVRAERALPVQE